jgi:hypothetical protein
MKKAADHLAGDSYFLQYRATVIHNDFSYSLVFTMMSIVRRELGMVALKATNSQIIFYKKTLRLYQSLYHELCQRTNVVSGIMKYSNVVFLLTVHRSATCIKKIP